MGEKIEQPSIASDQPLDVKIDTSGLKEELKLTVKEMLEDAKKRDQEELAKGKGLVSEPDPNLEKNEKIAESLKNGSSLKEQWTVPIPVSTKETAAHIRDYCQISPVLKG